MKKSSDYYHILNNNQLLRDASASCITLVIPKFNKNALNVNVITCTKESWQSRKAIYEKFQSSKEVIARSRICWYAIMCISTQMRSGTGINNDQLKVFIREKGEAFYNPDNQEEQVLDCITSDGQKRRTQTSNPASW